MLARSLKLSRRAALGTGLATLTAPFLARQANGQLPGIPRRFVVFHVPEGVPVDDADIFGDTPDYFWPDATLSVMPQASAPLMRHRNRVTFLKGLGFYGDGEDRHVQGMEDLLTGNLRGAPDRTAAGVNLPGGRSIDRILGEHLGSSALFPSYGLGILNHLEGVQEKRRLSYSSPNGGVDVVNDPLRAFDDLLAGFASQPAAQGPSPIERRLRIGQSVLDSAVKEIDAWKCRLGADGRSKLEHYADSVRGIEVRLQNQLNGAKAPSPVVVARPEGKGDSEFWSNLDNARELGEIQSRTAVAALAAGVTPVVLFQWNQSVSRQTYPWLDVIDKGMGGHDYAHASALKGDPPLWAAQRAKIFAWYFEQFATFLDMLAEGKEVDGSSLLDNTLVLYCSEMAHGHHGGMNLPFILAGKGGGKFRTGNACITFDERPHNDLLATILNGFGLEGAAVGRSEHNKGLLSQLLT